MKKILLALGCLLVLVSAAPHMAAADDDDDDDSYFRIWITDAYYAALDSDSLENDIVVYLHVHKSSRDQDFYLYMKIILPSGTFYAEYFFVDVYDRNFDLRIEAHNIATESGWYEAQAYLATPSYWGGGWNLELHDTLIFDPPGKGGGDPYWTMMLC
ncbi:MAG: hypothetical protein ACXAEI_12270 [Candidatus Hodarchaeales archaeon]|jgi:hypothetical protein